MDSTEHQTINSSALRLIIAAASLPVLVPFDLTSLFYLRLGGVLLESSACV